MLQASDYHTVLLTVWLYIAGSYILTNGTSTLPQKDQVDFSNLVEYVTLLFVLPLYSVVAFLSDYHEQGSEKQKELALFRNALFSSVLFPVLFVLWAANAFTADGFGAVIYGQGPGQGKGAFNYVNSEGMEACWCTKVAALMLDHRITVVGATLVLQLLAVDHGLQALVTDVIRSAEATVFFAVLSFSLQAFFKSGDSHQQDAMDAAKSAGYFFGVCVICGLYRRVLTDFLNPADEPATAKKAAVAAPVAAAAATDGSLFSDGEDAAATDAADEKKPKKVTRKKATKKKAPEPEPEPEAEFDEDEVEAHQVAFIPKSLRIDSPGRKANPIVSGSRRRKPPSRFTVEEQ